MAVVCRATIVEARNTLQRSSAREGKGDGDTAAHFGSGDLKCVDDDAPFAESEQVYVAMYFAHMDVFDDLEHCMWRLHDGTAPLFHGHVVLEQPAGFGNPAALGNELDDDEYEDSDYEEGADSWDACSPESYSAIYAVVSRARHAGHARGDRRYARQRAARQ